MTKKNDEIENRKRKIYDTKTLIFKYCKRYGIIFLIMMPIILVFNFIMSREVPGYTSVVSFFVTLGLLLLGCLVGLVIFTKIDDKREQNATKESERDPYAD
jgi:hypothetical protein